MLGIALLFIGATLVVNAAGLSGRIDARVSLSEGDSTKYQKSTARSFLTLESPQKTENKAR
jgi:hypothetical protein